MGAEKTKGEKHLTPQELLAQAKENQEKVKASWEEARKEKNQADANWTKFVGDFNAVYAKWQKAEAELDSSIREVKRLTKLAKKPRPKEHNA